MKRDDLQQQILDKNYSSPLYYDEPDFFRSIENEAIPSIYTAETAESMMTISDIEDCQCVKGETEEGFNLLKTYK